MIPCESVEDELTVDLPMEAVSVLTFKLLEPPPALELCVMDDDEEPTTIEPFPLKMVPYYAPPSPLVEPFQRFFAEWHRLILQSREFDRKHFPNAPHLRLLRLMRRGIENIKAYPAKNY